MKLLVVSEDVKQNSQGSSISKAPSLCFCSKCKFKYTHRSQFNDVYCQHKQRPVDEAEGQCVSDLLCCSCKMFWQVRNLHKWWLNNLDASGTYDMRYSYL